MLVKKPFFTIVFISWMMFITSLSLFSFEDVDVPSIRIPHLDKIVHFIFYFAAALFGYMSLKEMNSKGTISKKQLFGLLFLLTFYGIIIEVLQSVATVTRSGDTMDFLANTAGVICGLSIMYFSKKEKRT